MSHVVDTVGVQYLLHGSEPLTLDSPCISEPNAPLPKAVVPTLFLLTESITINHKDSRWVGAWWLGFIVTGAVMLLSSIPFWFLPKSLPKQGEEQSESKSTELATVAEQENFLPEESQDQEEKEGQVTFKQLAKGITQLFASFHAPLLQQITVISIKL